jgi:transcriptional regulator with XRE-family HTH domain
VPLVDTRQEIREFLTLRREEVASLAGVSIAYYTKLERGDASGVSETVLEALARALRLDEAERAHLFDLARAQNMTTRPRRRHSPQQVRHGVHGCSTRSRRRRWCAMDAWTSSGRTSSGAPSIRRCSRTRGRR